MVEFDEEKHGYNKEQVRQYILTFSEEYKELLEELDKEKKKTAHLEDTVKRQTERLKRFAENYKKLEAVSEKLAKENQRNKEQVEKRALLESKDYGEAIASALISAEMSAKRIVDEAQRKAELVSESATRNLRRILEAKQLALGELEKINEKISRVIEEETSSETAKEDAEKMFEGGGKYRNG